MSDPDESLTGLDHAGRARQHRFGSLSSRGALFHLTVRTGSRSKGQSARASAAYIQRAGEYGRERERAGADELLYTESGHMPAWAEAEPTTYWNAADLHERANGRLFKRLEFALPTALNADEQRELAVGFARHLTATEQLPYTLAIHAGGGTNPHCHLLISERGNDGLERSPEQWFRRYNAAEPEQGGARKTETLKPRAWLDATRAALAEQTNQALAAAGYELRIDHRSYAEQGIARVPGVHLGPTVLAMEARGIATERGNEARAVAQQNAELDREREELSYERAQQRELDPSGAGLEREGGDVGDRAGGLGAGDRGERGPGLGNGGRAGRGAEPERDRELAGRDADPGDAAHQADRAAAAGERGAEGADRAPGAGVGAVVATLDPGGVAGGDSRPARGPERGRGRDAALPDVRAAGPGSADLSRDVGGDDRGGEGADQQADPGGGGRQVADAAAQERAAEQQQAQERSQEHAEQLIAAGQERAQAEKRSQERAEQLIAAGQERAQEEKRERERQQKLERAREREQQRARERDDFDLER